MARPHFTKSLLKKAVSVRFFFNKTTVTSRTVGFFLSWQQIDENAGKQNPVGCCSR